MLANLRALFVSLVDIMLLRRGPEHLPASTPLLAMVIALNLALYSIADAILFPEPRPGAPAQWLVQLAAFALILVWFRVAFQLARKPERFVQTMIAVFAVNMLALPALPLFVALMPYAAQKQGGEPPPGALLLLVAVICSWVLAVLVRIVKVAFEWTWVAAIIFVISSDFGVLILLGLLFGESPKSP